MKKCCWLLLVVGLLLAGIPVLQAETDANVLKIGNPIIGLSYEKHMQTRIDTLMRENRLEEAKRLIPQFTNYLKNSYGHKRDEKILNNYNMLESVNVKLGLYGEAASTVRESHAWVPNPKNIDKVMEFTRKDDVQRQYFNMKMEYLQTALARNNEVLTLAREKQTLVNKMLQAKEVSKKDLEALQAEFKKIDEKMAAKQKEIGEISKKFEEALAKFANERIIFNRDQNNALEKYGRALDNVRGETYAINKKAQGGLLQIVEKFKWGWEGLDEKMTAMKKVQDSIMGLQKKMLELMNKKPFSDADKKAMLDYQNDMKKLMNEMDGLMGDIEKAFMDSKIFSQLTPEQQKKYYEMFRVMREAQGVIVATNQKIDAFIKKMTMVYGDVDGNGKVDKADLQRLAQYLLPRIVPFFGRRPIIQVYNKAADVDGDGKLTWADYTLITEGLSGNRKQYPADPNTKPGDVDGDGVVSKADVERLIKMISGQQTPVGAWKRIADLNGDGKLDFNDVIELVKKIDEPSDPVPPTDEPKEPNGQVASDTVASGTGNASGTGDASGQVTGTSTQEPGTNSQGASGIDNAY